MQGVYTVWLLFGREDELNYIICIDVTGISETHSNRVHSDLQKTLGKQADVHSS